MSLENKLKNVPRFNGSSRLFNYALYGLLSLSSVFGCDKGGGGGPPPDNSTPGNNNPVISSNLKTNADEGDNYFDRVIATDPDGDNLTFNLTQKPNGMSINSSDGSISWADTKEGGHPISVEVSDGKGGVAAQNSTLNVANKFDDISGRVLDILSGSNITTATDVILGYRDSNGNFVADFTTRNDSSGNYLFNRIPTGVNRLVKAGNNTDYFDILVGKLVTNKNETGVDIGLVPKTFNINFFDDVARNPALGGQMQKWLQIPQIYINTSPALGSGRQPTQQEIDLVESIFRNDISRFNNGFTNSNIQIAKGTNPPAFGTTGYIIFWWRDDLGSALGANSVWLNGKEIKSAQASVKTLLSNSQQLYVNRQECTQVFGPGDDSNLTASIFNDPQTTGIDNYTTIDLQIGKILYSKFIAPGNKRENGIDFVNPDDYTRWR